MSRVSLSSDSQAPVASRSSSSAPRVALYLRVSTGNQNTENQRHDLERVAALRGWHVVEVFADDGISGSKGRIDRPALDSLLKSALQRKFDLIAVWSIDRLGRSLQHLIETVNELQAVGVDLYIHQQAINTSTPAGRMVFGIFSALGEYERELIRERIHAGLNRARSEGKKLGRPSNVNPALIASVNLLREKGHSIHQIAKHLHIGVGTTHKILKAA